MRMVFDWIRLKVFGAAVSLCFLGACATMNDASDNPNGNSAINTIVRPATELQIVSNADRFINYVMDATASKAFVANVAADIQTELNDSKISSSLSDVAYDEKKYTVLVEYEFFERITKTKGSVSSTAYALKCKLKLIAPATRKVIKEESLTVDEVTLAEVAESMARKIARSTKWNIPDL